ncbi:major facilitator superfamily domain-containing protein [Phyllosticta capitalensis]
METSSLSTRAGMQDTPLETHDSEQIKQLGLGEFPVRPLSLFEEVLFVSTVVSVQFTAKLGVGQTLSILHIIGSWFDVSNPGVLSWLIVGYSLTVGSFILPSGRMGDVFGYKRMLLIGLSWYTIWSMVAGLSVYSNHVLFIVARVLGGIGPSISLPNALALLGASYPPGLKKQILFALFAAASPAGIVGGAALAGLFALAWWPWTYWSTAIALAFLTIAGSHAIPDPPCSKTSARISSIKDAIRELDLVGATTGITALVLINFAWNQAVVVGWQEPYVYVTLVLGLLLTPIFFYVEIKVSTKPLIPLDAINSDVGFVLFCLACAWGCFGVWIYYIWQQMEIINGLSPLLAAAWKSPVVPIGVVATIAAGYLTGRLHPATLMIAAELFLLVSAILVVTSPPKQTYWAQIFPCFLMAPFGLDLSFPAATLMMSNSVSKEHQGVAASLVNTVVNYSIALGLGMAGTVEQQIVKGKRPSFETTLEGYRAAWWFAIGFCGLGLVISIVFRIKVTLRERGSTGKDEVVV